MNIFQHKKRPAKIGKDAAEHGVAATVRRYQKLFLMRSVKECSVCQYN